MSAAEPKRDARWRAIYAAEFVRLCSEDRAISRRRALSIVPCMAAAERLADEELALRTPSVPLPSVRKKVRKQ